MSWEPGGYADRLGGRYEDRWAVKQLLRVLAEEVQSVTISPVGPDEPGVDLWVALPDGVREAHQCKGENRDSPVWTIADLARCNVLRNLRLQLERLPQNRFRFVSAVPAVEFNELTRSARDSSHAESYYRHQIRAGPERKKQAFARFCRAVEMNPALEEDRHRAHDLLLRSDTHLFADDQETNRDMRSQARYWITGDPGTALSVLMDLARNRLRRPIHADDIVRHLRANKLHTRNLALDGRLRPRIEALQRQFAESLESQLAGGRLIERPETRIVLESLLDDKASRLIVVHGTAGMGKSGVLYELTTLLDDAEIPFLPLRLDRQRPAGSVQSYSEELQLLASPAGDLHALAGDRTGVLILDQFDALRWTSAHASNAWEVGKEIIREALTKDLQVVVCCRTFDLENDPQIKGWKRSQKKLTEVTIGNLNDDCVRRAIEGRGGTYNSLTRRQQNLLRNALHLKIWLEISASADAVPQFESQSELMRAFWANRLEQVRREGLEESQAHALLRRLVEWMDQRASLDAPERLLRSYSGPARCLLSLGVLQLSGKSVAFAHQSYLDSLLAERLVEKIEDGTSTILEWLGEKPRQSLFRRTQLRLVLGALRDEARSRYLSGVRQLLDSKDVRFHVKQLVLQFLGLLESPLTEEVKLVSELLEQDTWRDHAIGETVSTHGPWFEALAKRGVWETWLAGNHEKLRNQTLRILRGVAETCGDRVARLLAPYERGGEDWSRRCVEVLSFNPAKDTDELFALRLRLIEAGFLSDVVLWRDFGAMSFTRLHKLLAALLLNWAVQIRNLRGTGTSLRQLKIRWYGLEDVDPEAAQSQELILAWRCLIPATALVLKAAKPRGSHFNHTTLAACNLDFRELEPILALLRKIGRKLAKELWQVFPMLSNAEGPDSPLADLLVMESLGDAPQDVEELADWALSWLMERPERLRLRFRHQDSPWAVSGKVIERFAVCCSESGFRRFESFLMGFREPDFLQDYRERHKYIMKTGLRNVELNYPSRFGVTQYHLLPRLLASSVTFSQSEAKRQRSDEASQLLRVLTEKFKDVHPSYFTGISRNDGGWVSSPRSPEILERLSEKTWLEIASNEGRARGEQPRRLGNRLFPLAASGELRIVTEREPERFARLALRFPATVNPTLLEGLLGGLQRTNPPDHLDAERHASWSPASGETLEKVLLLPQIREKSELAISVARVVRSHAGRDWPPEILGDLLHHAVHHPDPRPGTLNVRSSPGSDWDADSLDENTLNSTRSVVAYAVARVLFAHQTADMLRNLRSGIESLINDPHPVVRAASAAVCLAVLEIDAEKAITWFYQACDTVYPAVLGCRDVQEFLGWARWDHFDRMQPLMIRMIESGDEQVSCAGAEHVTACYLTQSLAEDLLKRCLEGTPAQRRGVARVAASLLSKPKFHAVSKDLLTQLADDKEEEVLRAVGEGFYRCDLSLFEPDDEFLVTFARSLAFQLDPSTLLHSLEGYDGPLIPFAGCILQAGRTFAQHLAPASRDMQTGVAGDTIFLAPLMLRLYEQSSEDPKHQPIYQECLDVWDQLIEERVGLALELTNTLDKV